MDRFEDKDQGAVEDPPFGSQPTSVTRHEVEAPRRRVRIEQPGRRFCLPPVEELESM